MIHWLRALRDSVFRRKKLDEDLDEELSAYMELATAEKVRTGMAQDEAWRATRRETDGVEQIRQRVRDVRVGVFLERLAQDLRYAARTLRKNPAGGWRGADAGCGKPDSKSVVRAEPSRSLDADRGNAVTRCRRGFCRSDSSLTRELRGSDQRSSAGITPRMRGRADLPGPTNPLRCPWCALMRPAIQWEVPDKVAPTHRSEQRFGGDAGARRRISNFI
jgi:hypothetical protein